MVKISKTHHRTKDGIIKKNPIKIKFKTKPMGNKWRTELEARYPGYFSEQPGLRKLVKKLLSYGGESVALVFEEDLNKILKRGVILDGSKSDMMKGEPGSCHTNSACLWRINRNAKSKALVIMTGWALSYDGVWRQHTWVYDKELKIPIETTEKRVAYFGFKLTDPESIKFYEDNW